MKDYNNKESRKNLTRKVIDGFIWMFSSSGIQGIMQMIVLVVLARLLLPEDFGIINAAMILIGFSKMFFMLGIGPAIIQLPNLRITHIRMGFSVSVIFGIIVAIIIYMLSPHIASFFKMEKLELVIKVLIVLFPIEGLSVVSLALLERELKFKLIAKVIVISYTFGYAFIGVLFGILGFGIWSLVIANISQALLRTLLLFYYQRHSIIPCFDKETFKELLFFGSGITLGKINNYIALQGDNIIIGRVLGAEALGLYSRAYQLMNIPSNLFGQIMDKVLFPAMSKIQNEKFKLISVYHYGIELTSFVMIPISILIFVLSPEIIDILLGQNWDQAVDVLMILSIGMLFRTSYKISESVARAKGAVYRIANRELIYAISIILGVLIGVNIGGIKGASVGVLFALFIQFLQKSQLAIKLVQTTWKDFIVCHVRSLILSLLLLIEINSFANLLRELEFNSFIVLLLTTALFVLNISIVLFLFPKLLFRKDTLNKLQLIIKSYSILKN